MVIHENFDWSLISEPPKAPKAENDLKIDINGFAEVKEEQPGENIYDENDINYESLIEQVECSSQSENDESENERPNVDVKVSGGDFFLF